LANTPVGKGYHGFVRGVTKNPLQNRRTWGEKTTIFVGNWEQTKTIRKKAQTEREEETSFSDELGHVGGPERTLLLYNGVYNLSWEGGSPGKWRMVEQKKKPSPHDNGGRGKSGTGGAPESWLNDH